jgi:phosphoenolpyruvate carboxykinase (GTP)
VPTPDALDLSGLNLTAEQQKELLAVDVAGWKAEIADVATNYAKFGNRLPAALNGQLESLKQRLG